MNGHGDGDGAGAGTGGGWRSVDEHRMRTGRVTGTKRGQ